MAEAEDTVQPSHLLTKTATLETATYANSAIRWCTFARVPTARSI